MLMRRVHTTLCLALVLAMALSAMAVPAKRNGGQSSLKLRTGSSTNEDKLKQMQHPPATGLVPGNPTSWLPPQYPHFYVGVDKRTLVPDREVGGTCSPMECKIDTSTLPEKPLGPPCVKEEQFATLVGGVLSINCTGRAGYSLQSDTPKHISFQNYTQPVRIENDFVWAFCKRNSSRPSPQAEWRKNLLTQAIKGKQRNIDRAVAFNGDNDHKLNIVMIGLDGVSEFCFDDAMQASSEFLHDLDHQARFNTFSFPLFSSVSWNRTENKGAILTGCNPYDAKCDPLPLWDLGRSHGFVSSVSEETCEGQIASSTALAAQCKDRADPDVVGVGPDHTLNPLFCNASKNVNENAPWKAWCMPDKAAHEVVFDHVKQFFSEYPLQNKLVSINLKDGDDNSCNRARRVDKQLKDLLMELTITGPEAKNTIVVVYSDSGINSGDFFQTKCGFSHHNRPMLFVTLPTALQNSKWERNLRVNQRRLVTGKDLYYAMHSVISGSFKTGAVEANDGLSSAPKPKTFASVPSVSSNAPSAKAPLIVPSGTPNTANFTVNAPAYQREPAFYSVIDEEISADRNCYLAGIHPDWCSCTYWNWTQIVDYDRARNVVSGFVTYMNDMNYYDYPDICAHMELSEIKGVWTGVAGRVVVYRAIVTVDPEATFMISFRVGPNHYGEMQHQDVHIYRISSFEGNSLCSPKKHGKDEHFCLCKRAKYLQPASKVWDKSLTTKINSTISELADKEVDIPSPASKKNETVTNPGDPAVGELEQPLDKKVRPTVDTEVPPTSKADAISKDPNPNPNPAPVASDVATPVNVELPKPTPPPESEDVNAEEPKKISRKRPTLAETVSVPKSRGDRDQSEALPTPPPTPVAAAVDAPAPF